MHNQVMHIIRLFFLLAPIPLVIPLMWNLYMTIYVSRHNKTSSYDNREYVRVVLQERMIYKVTVYFLLLMLTAPLLGLTSIAIPNTAFVGVVFCTVLMMESSRDRDYIKIKPCFLLINSLLAISIIFPIFYYLALVLLLIYSYKCMPDTSLFKKFT